MRLCVFECLTGCVLFLNWSGTEDYTQLQQLLKDISGITMILRLAEEKSRSLLFRKKLLIRKMGGDEKNCDSGHVKYVDCLRC